MINTLSKFYYGIEIDESNNKIDFEEASVEKTATLDIGSYTPTEFAAHITEQMNLVGNNTYLCSFNRTTRILTIAVVNASTVTLLSLTGTHAAATAYDIMGYDTDADTADSATHVSDAVCCAQYEPQFLLQSYVPVEHNIEQLHSTVNEVVTGEQELITFGDKGIMECNIKFITDIIQPSDGPITSNATGVADAIAFLTYISRKNKVEFIPNKTTPATFLKLILLSTQASKHGTTFELKEMYAQGLVEYYETQVMRFRELT